MLSRLPSAPLYTPDGMARLSLATEIAYRLAKPSLRRRSRELNEARRTDLPPAEGSEELLAGLAPYESSAVADNEWQGFAQEIATTLSQADLRSFLREDIISKTLHPNQYLLSWRYLAYLEDKVAWRTSLRDVCQESRFGDPWIDPSLQDSSPLLVQHCYHLNLLFERTGITLDDLDGLVEFGGGYGLVVRLLRQLGWRGHHLIYDLPPTVLLQQFYLRNVLRDEVARQPDLLAKVDWASGPPDADDVIAAVRATQDTGRSMFVATFSLTETSLPTREAFLPLIADFDLVWLAFQPFGQVDNDDWVANRLTSLPSHHWEIFECPAYRKSHYALGRRKHSP